MSLMLTTRSAFAAPDPVPYLTGRTLVWEDDFDGTALGADWHEDERVVNPNGELQAYTPRPQNVRVAGSCLMLTARRETFMGKTWTSGRVDTNDQQEFLYGRIEARMKHPVSKGMWPAFWMLGGTAANTLDEFGVSTWTGEPWPGCGEIDIMEAWGEEAVISSGIIHDAGGGTPAYETVGSGTLDRAEWHTYALEWTATQAAFYLDGVHRGTLDTDARPEFNRPMFLILNLAVSPGIKAPDETTPDVCVALVDWVRVYAPVTP